MQLYHRLVSVTPLQTTRPIQQPSPPEGDSVASTTLPTLHEGDQTISPPSPVAGELAGMKTCLVNVCL